MPGVGAMGMGPPNELIGVLLGGCEQRVMILKVLLHLGDMLTPWGTLSSGGTFRLGAHG